MASTVVLRSGCFALANEVFDRLRKTPGDLKDELLSRTERWLALAREINVETAPMQIKGIQIATPDFDAETAMATRCLGEAEQSPCTVNETLVWRINGELIDTPPAFEQLAGTKRFVHFRVGTCFGGCVNVASRMLTIAGDKASAHVERFAASAAALLIAMTPGRRSMSREAQLLMHTSRAVVFGDAKQLRKRADEIERFEDETAARLAKRTGQSVRWCRSLSDGRDFIFNSTEAKRHGLVDEITE